MGNWFEDHDRWTEQFGEFIEHLRSDDDDSNLTEEDTMFVSNLSAKVKRGEMSMHEGVHEIMRYVAAQMGYIAYRNTEAFLLDMQYNDHLEITEELQAHLLRVGEPGIADAIVMAYASMELIDPDYEGPAAVGLHTKGWFQANRMTSDEDRHFKWAVRGALIERYGHE